MITQGKWEIKDIGYPKDREYWIANNGNVIARVTRVLTDETEAIDNARLIAAAPELLATAQEIIADFDNYGEVLQQDDNSEYGKVAPIERLRQAIAKAEQSSSIT